MRVKNLTDACQQKFPTWDAALAAYTRAYRNNDLEAFPEPNSRFWTQPIRVRDTAQVVTDTSSSSDDELWTNFADEDSMASIDQSLNGLLLNWCVIIYCCEFP